MTQAIVIDAEVGWMVDISPEDRGLKVGQIVDVLGWVYDGDVRAIIALPMLDENGNPVERRRFFAVEAGLLEPVP